MARKKRRRKSRSKKKKHDKALDVTIASTEGAPSKPKERVARDEPRGFVSGEFVSITSGEIVVKPEKALDVSFGEEESSSIIVEDGEVVAEAQNQAKATGEIVVDHTPASPEQERPEEGGIIVEGDGVIVEGDGAVEEHTPTQQELDESPTPVPEEISEAPTEKVEAQQEAPSPGGAGPSQPNEPVLLTHPKAKEAEAPPAGDAQEPVLLTHPKGRETGSVSGEYLLSEEDHARLLARKREEEKRRAQTMMGAFPSPFSLADDLQSIARPEFEKEKFSAQGARPTKELKLESLKDLVPPKEPVSEEAPQQPETQAPQKPQPKPRERQRRPSGSMSVDAAFTEEEKAFFEADLEEEDDSEEIQEIFEKMDAHARANQRGWLDSLKELIAPGKKAPSKRKGRSHRRQGSKNSKKPKGNK